MKRKNSAVAGILLLTGLLVVIGFLLLSPWHTEPEVITVTKPGSDTWALGTVRASDGTPVAGATVTFANDDGSRSATTGEDGNFRMKLPAGGDYRITVAAAERMFDLGRKHVAVGGPPEQFTLDTDLTSEAQAASLEYRAYIGRLEAQVAELETDTYTAVPPPAPAAPAPPAPPEWIPPPPPAPEPPVAAPAPAVAEQEPLPPGPEEERCKDEAAPCRVQVFFATDRNVLPKQKQRKREANFQIAFGGERSRDPKKPMTYGWCDVTIPKNHRKTTGVLDQRKGVYDVQNSVFIWDVVPAKDENEFLAKLRDRVNDDENMEMLVFIHGYNTSFFEAARRTAQLHWDLGFRGAPAFFSWPSGGSLLDYWADEASSEWASSHLREFLDLLAAQSGAKKIHLIAHSMGNRPLTRALAEIGRRNPECDPPAQFSQVIMAAPDLDRDMFFQLKDAMQNASERVTLYASKRDRAVLGSWLIHRFSRLGIPTGKPPVDRKIEAVDASNASTGFLGHSYYGASILWDVKVVLDHPQLRVDQRCTIDRADPIDAYPRFRRQIDPKEVPPWWRRVFRKKPAPDVVSAECRYPSATAAGAITAAR